MNITVPGAVSQKAEVIREGLFNIQVCVPSEWTNEQIEAFAKTECPCGTSNGWMLRAGGRVEENDKERQPCLERSGFIHMILDA